ncbi:MULTISPECIES: nucleotidyltransferase [Bacillaceae]|uniref:tRNA(Met) cytidine acetate ligase n=1 Tax=Evansella alkalicola TaxID=745819 RepID=A0ABS6JPU5_9BACI|nr:MULTISPECIES: nucleotidyltransferase [Bacillaceae]MBU9720460.1 nucleotidyltransferase [Bacillus alkalicola]
MNILGIVVEYNPFHLGHLHHLRASQEKTKADITIAVMSGSFLQRGEPALTDKWRRTKMALKNGVDLVIELPYIYSTQKAETFSDGAVSLLDTLGVNKLCFGSESGEIDAFQQTVEKVTEHEHELDLLVKQYVKRGLSYPKAFSEAFDDYYQDSSSNTIDLTKPNNILGYQYVKSIKKRASSIKAYTITREKSGYHEKSLSNKIASATAIRHELIEKGEPIERVEANLPKASTEELLEHMKLIGDFAHWEHYFPLLQYKIMTETSETLCQIYECEEGLEHRLKKYIFQTHSFHHFMEKVKTKRYTWTRLQRLFVHILMNTTKAFMEKYCEPLSPPYIRILGMSTEGRDYLSSIKNSLSIPLITRAMQMEHPVLQRDTLSAQIHALPYIKKYGLTEEIKGIPIQFNKEKNVFTNE